MSENFAEMLANEEWKEIHTGEVVDGTVIAVKEDHIVLNIGYKHDGIITRSEYSSTPGIDLTTVVSVGDEMKAKVLKLNDGEGQVLLTYRKLVAESGSKRLEEAFNNKEAITANVSRVIKGGLEVVVDETRIFIPASLVSDSYVKDFSEYNGKEITFAHVMGGPAPIIYQKLGLNPHLDYRSSAIGVMNMTPPESAVIASDIAVKSGNVYLGFADRFTGTLIITGEISDVTSALTEVVDYFRDSLGYVVCDITKR